MYSYKQLGNSFIVSIKNHTEITQALAAFVKDQGIKAGSVKGIGAVKEVTLRFFDPATKEYINKTFNEQMEVSNIVGNISRKDGEPYLHLHITLGRSDFSTLSGHLLTGIIHGAGEIIVEKFDGHVGRFFDDETGLNLFTFEAD